MHDTASGDCHFCALCDDNPSTAVPQDHFQANNSGFTDPHLDFFIEYVTYSAVLDQPRLHPNAETRATHRRYLQLLLFRISRGTSCYPPCNRVRSHFPSPSIPAKENSSTALSYYTCRACEPKTGPKASGDHFWLNDPCLYSRLVFVLSKWNFL